MYRNSVRKSFPSELQRFYYFTCSYVLHIALLQDIGYVFHTNQNFHFVFFTILLHSFQKGILTILLLLTLNSIFLKCGSNLVDKHKHQMCKCIDTVYYTVYRLYTLYRVYTLYTLYRVIFLM